MRKDADPATNVASTFPQFLSGLTIKPALFADKVLQRSKQDARHHDPCQSELPA
jgi:hypothetical protein